MMRVMVTGAFGFVGSALTIRLVQSGLTVLAVGRQKRNQCLANTFVEMDLTRTSVFPDDLMKVDCIVHLAGRAHVGGTPGRRNLEIYREVNRDATISLARAALLAGVKRFIFISSIGVNGCVTDSAPFTEQSIAAPQSDYAISKWEAEVELKRLVMNTSMELVIIRPPLIYAGQAPGNFARLLKAIDMGVPLPLQSVVNSRSVVSLDNFVNFLELCIHHDSAAGELFLVQDSQSVSTPDMIRSISAGMGKVPKLVPCPSSFLQFALARLGKNMLYDQLCGSLQVDDSKARALLGWVSKYTAEEGLRRAGAQYSYMKNRT